MQTYPGHPRDQLIYSLALRAGLRIAEVVGLDVGDVFAHDGTSRSCVRIRPEIAKGGRTGDVFPLRRPAPVRGPPTCLVQVELLRSTALL